ELKGKFDGLALRVPTPTVSVVDLVAVVSKETSVEEVNNAFREASKTSLKGILEVADTPLVSVDFKGNKNSAIVDAPSTMVTGNLVKVIAWYDNELGYSYRLVDLIDYMARKGL
ncbi:MAG: type I glyceraldehyde-3-phosphate dehydrogenase, partial [Candidatus Thermoplasmatota archaeon]